MDSPSKELLKEKYLENFDLVQKSPEQVSYKKVSRKREDRRQKPGYARHLCKDYYECLQLDDKNLKVILKKVSRHRGKSPPKTPDNQL